MTARISLLAFIVIFAGCISTARISSFPKTATAIDFDSYSTSYHEKKEAFWTGETSNEYYIQRETTIGKPALVQVIKTALEDKGYYIHTVDTVNNYVLAKRGMLANEWNSITGVYYKLTDSKVQLYINTKITQDITGGWSENRAKKIGNLIEAQLDEPNRADTKH